MATRTDRAGDDSGWPAFAGLLGILIGVFNIAEGLFAIFNDRYLALAAGQVYIFDFTGWGWLHLVLGIIVIGGGAGILAGRQWARGAGIGLAGAAALIAMVYLPVFPWWSIVNIALCVLVIYALVVPPHSDLTDGTLDE